MKFFFIGDFFHKCKKAVLFLALPLLISFVIYNPQETDEHYINIRDLGALGLGIPSLVEDSTALTQAVDSARHMRERGDWGRTYIFIPHPSAFYAFSGDGLVLCDSLTIYGEDTATEIRHVNPNNSRYFNASIFYISTYNLSSVLFAPSYSIENIKAKTNYVVVKDSMKIKVGEVFLIGGDTLTYHKDEGSNFPYFSDGVCNEADSIHGDTIFCTYDFKASIKGNTKLVRINSGQALSPLRRLIGKNKHEYIPQIVCKDVHIFDLKLTQADHDEVHNLPLDTPRVKLSAVIKGGGFRFKAENLVISAYSALPAGNLYCHDTFVNIHIDSCSHKAFDAGFNSHDNYFSNFTYNIFFNGADSFSLFSIQQGSHDETIENFYINGSWRGRGLIHIHADRITMRNININLPKFDSTFGWQLLSAHNIFLGRLRISVKDVNSLELRDDSCSAITINNVSFKTYK